jgi:hypothetical protein
MQHRSPRTHRRSCLQGSEHARLYEKKDSLSVHLILVVPRTPVCQPTQPQRMSVLTITASHRAIGNAAVVGAGKTSLVGACGGVSGAANRTFQAGSSTNEWVVTVGGAVVCGVCSIAEVAHRAAPKYKGIGRVNKTTGGEGAVSKVPDRQAATNGQHMCVRVSPGHAVAVAVRERFSRAVTRVGCV